MFNKARIVWQHRTMFIVHIMCLEFQLQYRPIDP